MIDYSLWRIGALLGSLVPGLLIGLLILRSGQGRMSRHLLAVAVACGAMISVLPLATSLLGSVAQRMLDPMQLALVRAFFLAGLFEEAAKLVACYFIVRTYFERRTSADLILGCAGVALGFALIENVSYVARAPEAWKTVALARAISAVPTHVFIGLSLGLGLAKAETEGPGWRRNRTIGCTLVVAAILHGLYDLPQFLGENLPLSPAKVQQIAALLSVSVPTLLAAAFLFAVILICSGALRALRACRYTTLAGDGRGPPSCPVSPLTERFIFSNKTGLGLGGLTLALSIASFVIGGLAYASGAALHEFLNTLSIGVMLATLGWMFAGEGIVAAALDLLEPERLLKAPLTGKQWAIRGGGSLVALISAYFSYLGIRYAVASLLVMSGGWFSGVGAIDKALSNYTAALAYRPDFIPALLGRADVYRILQNYDRALSELDEAVRFQPLDPSVHGARGVILNLKHEYAKSLAELERAVALGAGDLKLLVGRGEVRFDSGDLDGAMVDANRALVIDPSMGSAHALKARILTRRDDASGALNEYDAALHADPKNAGAYFSRGLLHFENRRYHEAALDFQRALVTGERTYVPLWLFLARARAGQDGRRELAMWREVAPQKAWPYPLIELYLGMRQTRNAVEAAKTPDQRCELSFYAGELAYLAKLEPLAVELLQRAVNTCPKEFVEHRAAIKDLPEFQAAAEVKKKAASKPTQSTGEALANAAPGDTPFNPKHTPPFPRFAAHPPVGVTPSASNVKVEASEANQKAIDKFVSSLNEDTKSQKMKITYLDTKYSEATRELVINLSLDNRSGEAVRFGEIVTKGIRFQDPAFFIDPIIDYPSTFVSRTAIPDNEAPIYSGKTRETQIKIANFDRVLTREPGLSEVARSATRFDGDIAFFSSSGRRHVLHIEVPLGTPNAMAVLTERDRELRERFLKGLNTESPSPVIQATTKDATYDPRSKLLTLDFKIHNSGVELVKFGSLIVDGRRFLNPKIYTAPVRNYPLQLVFSSSAFADRQDPLSVGETRDVRFTISEFEGVIMERKSQRDRSTQRLGITGFLEFWSPVGHRFITPIAFRLPVYQ